MAQIAAPPAREGTPTIMIFSFSHRWGQALPAAAAAVLLASTFFVSVTPAAAREDCILDNCVDKATTEPISPGLAQSGMASRAGNFDFYVLALSWSAGFCEKVEWSHDQCEPGRGLGFVVHGLWPQYERGYPSNCPGPGNPSSIALDRVAGLYPDQRLARYEWRKHGTCTGKSPSDYFADVARARAAVTIPEAFSKPNGEQTFAPIDIERAFYAANPRLRPGMMTVGCSRGVLEEVRICLTKDLREFRACPEVVRRGCRAREISVPAPL